MTKLSKGETIEAKSRHIPSDTHLQARHLHCCSVHGQRGKGGAARGQLGFQPRIGVARRRQVCPVAAKHTRSDNSDSPIVLCVPLKAWTLTCAPLSRDPVVLALVAGYFSRAAQN